MTFTRFPFISSQVLICERVTLGSTHRASSILGGDWLSCLKITKEDYLGYKAYMENSLSYLDLLLSHISIIVINLSKKMFITKASRQYKVWQCFQKSRDLFEIWVLFLKHVSDERSSVIRLPIENEQQ